MYYKTVEVDLGDGVKCTVDVACTPQTPQRELKDRALAILKKRIARLETH